MCRLEVSELQTRLAEIQKSAAPELSFVKVAQENSVASSNIHPLLSPGAGPGSAAFWIGLKCRGKVLKASLHQVKITTAEYCNYLQLLYVTSSNICLISAHNKGEPVSLSSDCRISRRIARVSSSVIRRSRRRKPKSSRIRR